MIEYSDLLEKTILLLSPYLAKAGDTMAEKMGSEAPAKLWSFIKEKFTGDSAETAEKLEKAPSKKNLDKLKLDLEEELLAKPALVEELSGLLETIGQGDSFDSEAHGDDNIILQVKGENHKITIRKG